MTRSVPDLESLSAWFGPEAAIPASQVYLVGGAVRDGCLGRAPRDLDVVCRGAAELARVIANRHEANCVPFDKGPGMVCHRLMDRKGSLPVLDIAELRGEDIEADLRLRDFTINAMAAAIGAGGPLGPLIDPLQGLADLNARVVRMTAPEAFNADPLRLLRAVRLAAELEFSVEPVTLDAMRSRAAEIARSAAERIREELFRILAAPKAAAHLRLLDDLGILAALLPEIGAMKGCAQNTLHHQDVWEHSLTVLEECGRIVADLHGHFADAADRVRQNLAEGDRLAVLLLAALLHDMGKPAARAVQPEDGRITFYGHERIGADMAEAVTRRLKMSNRDRDLFRMLVARHMHAKQQAGPNVKTKTRLKMLRAHMDDAVPLLILAMADASASRGPAADPAARENLLQWARNTVIDYYAHTRQDLQRRPLLQGRDLAALGVAPGPGMGRLLEAVREAQDAGEIRTREEALERVSAWLHAKPAGGSLKEEE